MSTGHFQISLGASQCKVNFNVRIRTICAKGLTQGSFFFKSHRNLKIGRRHGSDFVHIVFLNTLRHAKTKSEVLGPSLTWFWNNGRFNFLLLSKIAPLFFTFFCIIQISWSFAILMDMYNNVNTIIKNLNYILTI